MDFEPTAPTAGMRAWEARLLAEQAGFEDVVRTLTPEQLQVWPM